MTRSINIGNRTGCDKGRGPGRSYFLVAAISLLVATLMLAIQYGSASSGEPPSQARAQSAIGPYSVFVPIAIKATNCPTSSTSQFATVPVDSRPTDHPDYLNADLNLDVRGYERTTALLDLVDYGGDTDPNAPQLPGLFADNRKPTFTSAYQVYDWNWASGEHGSRGSLLTNPQVTLLGMGTTPGEPIRIPSRVPEIYIGGFKAMVLYAEENRITLTYTRQDAVAPFTASSPSAPISIGVAVGYAIHIENLCVDPNLLALYRQMNAAGRGSLPALRNGETLGTASGNEIAVAVRDNGAFMDPRSRKDWWLGW